MHICLSRLDSLADFLSEQSVQTPRTQQYALLDPPPPYAASGSFAVNIWLKTRAQTDLNGTGFAYLLSHTARRAALNSRGLGPDQVRGLNITS